MQEHEHDRHHHGYGGNRLKAKSLRDEAGQARQGRSAKHRGAYLKADGVGGERLAKALGSAGHEAGVNGGQAQAAQGERNGSQRGGMIQRKERGARRQQPSDIESLEQSPGKEAGNEVTATPFRRRSSRPRFASLQNDRAPGATPRR